MYDSVKLDVPTCLLVGLEINDDREKYTRRGEYPSRRVIIMFIPAAFFKNLFSREHRSFHLKIRCLKYRVSSKYAIIGCLGSGGSLYSPLRVSSMVVLYLLRKYLAVQQLASSSKKQ